MSTSGGLVMPKRGNAARMLSELNAEHAPTEEDINRLDTASLTPSSTPASDTVNNKTPDLQYDKSYGNMTSHTTGNKTDHIPDQKVSNAVRRSEGQKAVQPTSRKVGNMAGQKADVSPVQSANGPTNGGAFSLRDAIKATVQQGTATLTLKTVTIKLAPDLDKKVEDHCYQSGRKKQEVVRDALLLYFEVVEGDMDESEDGG